MLVNLNPGEMAVAHHWATLRRCVNQSVNIKDKRIDRKLQAIELDILGSVAELAWMKLFNKFPDFSVTVRSGTSDAVIGGRSLDIKATPYASGELRVTPSKKDDPSDVYVLAIVRESEVRFAGYAKANQLFRDENLKQFDYGPSYVMTQQELMKFSDDFVDRMSDDVRQTSS